MTSKSRFLPSIVFFLGLLPALLPSLASQTLSPQQTVVAGLRSSGHAGQFNAVLTDSTGNLYLLLDQKDGVRVLKTDSSGKTVLAEALIGGAGDSGLAMTFDPAGNLYVTGTSTSGSLAATPGAAFSSAVDTTANSFVAKFDPSLNLKFTTFGGSGRAPASAIAATADAVFITGLIYGSGLPVTPGGIIQEPAYNTVQNGFVEKFSADGTTLLYATYLSGQGGDTSPQVIAVDAQDDAYIAGFTTATGFPTIAALIPRAVGITSGFLTELTPEGDGITFSTFIPGTGISALALDSSSNTLLLSGTISLGQFPIATVTTPLVRTDYQVLLRLAIDGTAVLSSTVLAPGSQSFLAPAGAGVVWMDGTLSTPLLPGSPISNLGNGFALRVTPRGTLGTTVIDQVTRFGGLAAANPNFATLPLNLTSLAVDAGGSAVVAGSVTPTASTSLLATQTFDLPLTNAPTAALPSVVHDGVAATGSCPDGACAGSAAYLARITPTGAPSLALSTDTSPLILLRNLGSVQAADVTVTASGFTTATTCGSTLAAGGDCTILLGGAGPGTLTIAASNAATQTASLATIPAGTTANTLVFSPRELDFGIQTSASPASTRTITITNLDPQNTQTFTSKLNGNPNFIPYSFTEVSSDCTIAGLNTSKQLAPGATCHITVGFAASSDATKDGPAQANWSIGGGNVLLTGYGQSSALSLSAGSLDFGTQFYGGLRSARYLYISNSSSTAIAHTPVSLPSGSAFTVTDRCPAQLNPQTVCQIQLAYEAAQSTSTDATTLSLDQGLSVLVTGQTIPQPGTNGSSSLPTLVVTPSTLTFATPVVVTGVSSSTQTVSIQNTGTSPFTLALSLTGDFTDQTNCVASLAAGATCNVVLTFAPSQPGSRQGLLGVTAGSGTSPVYVSLSGTATAILPANNGTLDFGNIPVGQPSVQWYKVTQPFSTLSALSSSSTFKALLVEDTGSGHGQPPSSAFLTATTGSCNNCWLGLQFTAPAVGPQSATLTLRSSTSGSAYNLALTGNGLALTGLVLSPITQNFGPVAVNSSSAPQLFTLTNLNSGGAPITVGAPVLSGNFTLASLQNGGAPCSGTLAASASCFLQVVFTPGSAGQLTGTLSIQTGTGTVSASLSGFGAPDPGIAFNPNALVFNNVPDISATQQTISVANTGSSSVQIGALSNAQPAFQTSTTCGTLAPAATCTITVSYVPASANQADTLQVPVTTIVGGAPVVTNYTVALSSTYTASTAGLQIVPGTLNFGPFPVNIVGGTRQFTINNLTAKSLNLNIVLPREFVPAGAPCTSLAPNSSCNFSLSFVPITAGNITGSLSANGIPSDGSSAVNGIGYLQGYGTGTGTLSVTGNIQPGQIVPFGQVASGQSSQQTLTLTNTATGTITIHRITSRWPFLSTTTCGTTLATGQSCTVTVSYTPLNQVALGTASPPANTDGGTLLIESDALSSPDTINFTGTANPIAVVAPSSVAPALDYTISQNSLAFASTGVGFASAPQSVTLTNTGNTVIHIGALSSSPDFTVTGSCPVLLPGATCTLTITFTPQVSSLPSGSRIGVAQIATDSSTSLEFVSLIGAATPSTLTFQPSSLDFGTRLLGSTATLPIRITNSGIGAATFTSLATTGEYTVGGACPTSGGSLAANASCTAQVSFTPTAVGVRSGTLALASSASSLPLTVSLTGAGAQSNLKIAPASLTFPAVAVGATATSSLTITNTGTSASISGLALAITGDYTVTTPCSVTTLVAGASCAVVVTFAPISGGTRPGTLTVSSSDPSSPNTIPLTGTGLLQPRLQLSASSLTFPTTAVGATSSLSLTFTNTGISSITGITLVPAGDFAVTTPCGTEILAPAAACTATVAFTPTAAGARTGTLTVTSSDVGSPATVSLSGTATSTGTGNNTSFTLTVDGGTISTKTVTQSRPASYTLTVTPLNGFTGTVVLNCSSITAAPSATCSMLPSSIALNGGSQSATVTISTISSAGNAKPFLRRIDPITLCLLAPTGLLFWRFRKVLRKQRISLLVALLCTSIMLVVSGCGSSGIATLQISPAGTYQYSATASSTTGVPVTQTVMLNLVIQ